ncbi:MAG: polysaccharide deacetylase family protein [bacterium]|nr:polysaccharide deacetylase family protein [bacterium]
MAHDDILDQIAVPLLRRAPFRHVIHRTFPRPFFASFHRLKASRLALDASTYVLSFDLDHRADVAAIPDVLRTLRRYEMHASFACVGRWVELFPREHAQIVADGHEIVNHSYSHPDHPELSPHRSFRSLSPAERRGEIEQCHATCARILRYEPVGFRTPHFGRAFTDDTYEMLRDLGYQYSSSTVDVYQSGCGIPSRHGDVMEIPLGCSSRFPFYTFDSWSARRAPHSLFGSDGAFLKEFERTIIAFAKHRSFLSHYFDPADVVGAVLDGFCAAICDSGIVTMTYRTFLDQYRSRLWTRP